MHQERFFKQTISIKVNEKRPVSKWLDFTEDLNWNLLGLHPSEIKSVVVDQEVWRLNLELLLPQSSRKSG